MDTNYRLIVSLETRGTLVPAMASVGDKAKSIDGLFSKIADKAGDIGKGLADSFASAVETAGAFAAKLGGLGAAAGIGAVTYGVTGLNAELEKTQTSLGALFSVHGKANGMTEGIQLAGDVMKQMRRDAAELPGEFSDLLGFFRLGATPGFQAGTSVKDMETLSANAMATAASLGMDMHQASREFAMLLQGRAGAHNIFGSMLGFSGDEAQKFNAKSADARLKDITAALGQYEQSRKAFSNTFDALSSTLIDNSKKFLGGATSGLFEKVKNAMREANEWFDKNESIISSWGTAIGDRLIYAFELGKAKLLEWGPVIWEFAKNAYHEFQHIADVIMPILRRLEPGAKALLGGDLNGKVEGVAAMYAAAKFGPGLLSSASSGLGALGISSGVMLPVGAAVAAGGAAMYMGAQTDEGHRALNHTLSELAKTGDHLLAAFEPLEPAVLKVATVIGIGMLDNLNAFVFVVEKATSLFSAMSEMAGDMFKSFASGIDTVFGTGLNAKLNVGRETEDSMDAIRKSRGFDFDEKRFSAASAAAIGEASEKQSKRSVVTGGGGTNIQKVEIVVSSNADPERIARITVNKLQSISRYPTASRGVRNFSQNRTL